MVDMSVVIPVRNEEANLPELVVRLGETLRAMNVDYEVIFVTDVNRDNTFGVLRKLHAGDPHLKVIKLTNSFGQHVAVYSGLQACCGRAVTIMDGDLQDLPEDIPLLYAKMSEGFDVVYATKQRKDDSAMRNLSSKVFIKLLDLISDFPLEYNTSMYRMISRRTVDELLKFREREPSLPAFISLIGFPSAKVQVTSGKRVRGKTNYSFLRQLNFAIGFLLSFSTKPLRVMSVVGIIIAGFSFANLFYVIIQSVLWGTAVMGWPTIVSLVTLLGGMQLIGLGVIGEYVGRIFLETKHRPPYFVEERLGDLQRVP